MLGKCKLKRFCDLSESLVLAASDARSCADFLELSSGIGDLLLLFSSYFLNNSLSWLRYNLLDFIFGVEEPGWKIIKIISLFLSLFGSNSLSLGNLTRILVKNWIKLVEKLPLCLFNSLLDLISSVDELWNLNFNIGANDQLILILHVVDPSLRLVFFVLESVLFIVLVEQFELLRSADTASERENATLLWVLARGRVSDSKRAVNAVAILDRHVSALVCP